MKQKHITRQIHSQGKTAGESLSGDRDYDLWVLFRNTNDTILKVRYRELNELSILGRQAAVLLIVQRIEKDGGTPTPAEIARWTLREPHTISGTLSRMEKEGLIRKVRDLDRRNQIRVAITQKGYGYYQRSAQRKSIHRILSCLSAEEYEQLRTILEKLRTEGRKELGIEQKMPWP